MLGLVPERVHDLVDPDRQIGMRPDPEGVHGIDRTLARGTERQFHVEGRCAPVRHPVDLLLEPLYMLGLLCKLVFGDEERKERLLVVPVHQFAQQRVDVSPECEPERVPDIEALDRVADVHDLGPPQDFVVPSGKVIFRGKRPMFFSHGYSLLKLQTV